MGMLKKERCVKILGVINEYLLLQSLKEKKHVPLVLEEVAKVGFNKE